MGFEEIPHTADWSLHVWSDSLAGLLAESARGMNTLSGALLVEYPREVRVFETIGLDKESLLVSFLTELVYYSEQENLSFDQFDFDINGDRLRVRMEGASLKSLEKVIKAVTWHNLKIEDTARGLEVEIVFDV
jgi:SHS2 domain-containing protein